MPRTIYIISSYILTTIFLSIYINHWFLLLFLIFIPLIIIDASMVNSNDYHTMFFHIFYLGKLKRIKTEYGRFYLRIRNSEYGEKIHLLKDNFFILEEIGEAKYENIEKTKSWIKGLYQGKYDDKLKKDKLKNEIKSWNGYLDKQSERDGKLEEIL